MYVPEMYSIKVFFLIDQFAKDHFVEYELSEDDLYTFRPTYRIRRSKDYPNPKHLSIPGQMLQKTVTKRGKQYKDLGP
jgi:iron complex outermembrane receptor protein